MADDGAAAAVEGPDFRPLYAQVRELMIRRMLRGDWRPGELLPSEGRLAAEFGEIVVGPGDRIDPDTHAHSVSLRGGALAVLYLAVT